MQFRYEEAKVAADRIATELGKYCERLVVAGSIRRQCEYVSDIEIVCVPKTMMRGLFGDLPEPCDGFCKTVNKMPAIKGTPEGRYTRRKYGKFEVDIFITHPANFGYILAIRTGSVRFSHEVLAKGWKQRGFRGDDGMLCDSQGNPMEIAEEHQLFKVIGIPWVDPVNRR